MLTQLPMPPGFIRSDFRCGDTLGCLRNAICRRHMRHQDTPGIFGRAFRRRHHAFLRILPQALPSHEYGKPQHAGG
jgi:hypothetical protein